MFLLKIPKLRRLLSSQALLRAIAFSIYASVKMFRKIHVNFIIYLKEKHLV